MADIEDLKSSDPKDHAGSSPASGTNIYVWSRHNDKWKHFANVSTYAQLKELVSYLNIETCITFGADPNTIE